MLLEKPKLNCLKEGNIKRHWKMPATWDGVQLLIMKSCLNILKFIPFELGVGGPLKHELEQSFNSIFTY